ncbi:hypothetical protein EIP91_008861 [Steccherinum ochraceum]|uniref:Uncharacterized protein n=1 Tax=Steccherinum ochraceum TaxID=92696 RepID=A0A4R0RRP9_9APHY|nr:hypothetical protein EIP91_008861 [Steccherinum ochraceum]
MIAGFSKFINQYLAPLLSLTSLVLVVFVFLSPVSMLNTQVSLLTVRPTGDNSDGPSIFLGPLGSCERPSNDAGVNCTQPNANPKYDTSFLPGNAPDLLSAPIAATPVFIAISIAFTIAFFFMFTFTAFRHRMGKFGALFEKPDVQRASAWVGLFGFMTGLICFLITRVWFGKAVEDFNKTIISGGTNSPQLVADTSNGFIMVWVAYAFYAVPLVSSMAKLHVTATKQV